MGDLFLGISIETGWFMPGSLGIRKILRAHRLLEKMRWLTILQLVKTARGSPLRASLRSEPSKSLRINLMANSMNSILQIIPRIENLPRSP